MKKLISAFISLIILVSLCTTAFASTTTATTSAPYYGRLTIASVGISVGLYNSSSQEVCDATDSACFYHFKNNLGMTIADHNYQAFRNLTRVRVGTTGTIKLTNGGIITIKCTEVCEGTNAGSQLLDSTGAVATGRSDYLTYTCTDTGIYICQWTIVSAKNIDANYDNNFDIDNRTRQNTLAAVTTSNNCTVITFIRNTNTAIYNLVKVLIGKVYS